MEDAKRADTSATHGIEHAAGMKKFACLGKPGGPFRDFDRLRHQRG